MSLIAKIFGGGGGGKSRGEVPSAGEAIQRLLKVEEMLIKKQEYLEKKAEQELQIAKKNGTKNKQVALRALRRKKKYAKQLVQIDGTLTTIEYQREALENAKTNTEILKAMGYAAKALEKAHGDMNIDDLNDLMDDIHEQHNVAQELSDAISKPFGIDKDIDDDEILEELDALVSKDIIDDLVSVPGTEDLPNLPAPKAAKSKVEDEDGLKELAAWAS